MSDIGTTSPKYPLPLTQGFLDHSWGLTYNRLIRRKVSRLENRQRKNLFKGRADMGKAGTRLGVLVGGGPAPGINSTMSAAVIEAGNSGLEVVGIYDGFEHLINGSADMVRPLAISDVSRIHFQGGSMLRTSRANPTTSPEALERTVGALRELGIGYLVTIGGDDTAFSAYAVAKAAAGER